MHWTTAFAFQADPLWVQGQTLAGYWMLSSATSKVQPFFFFSCRVWVLSWRGFFPFILSSIFKHWFGGDFKWERNGASARYLEGNCYPQHKHSHPQTIAQNPNNWLGSPEELDRVKSHLFVGTQVFNRKDRCWTSFSHSLALFIFCFF